MIQGIAGRLDLGLHATSPVIALCPELDVLRPVWVVVGKQVGSVLLGRSVIDAVHVGHEDGKVRAHVHGDPAGKRVVVGDVEHARSGGLGWRRRYCVVGVDDRDDVEGQHLPQGVEQLAAGVVVDEVLLSDQHLANDQAIVPAR